MLKYNELKPGIIFLLDAQPYQVLTYRYVRMQQRRPVAQVKIKNLLNGKITDFSARQSDIFEEAEIDKVSVIFVFSHRDEFWFHKVGEPGNRFSLSKDVVGDASRFMKPNTEVTALYFGNKLINIELPIKVQLKVVEAPPSYKGNTAQGSKRVKLETGYEFDAPFFIEEGDIVEVNTESGEYTQRVGKEN